jgi:hypothetical protein
MVRAWNGRGMASVNQTRPHCVNEMGKTHSKPLVTRHGRRTAWARHATCESAFRVSRDGKSLDPTPSTGLVPGYGTVTECFVYELTVFTAKKKKKQEYPVSSQVKLDNFTECMWI